MGAPEERRVVGRYRIHEPGTSTVFGRSFVADDPLGQGTVTVHVLRAKLPPGAHEGAAFVETARRMQMRQRAHVVELLEVGITPAGEVFRVVERDLGPSLEDVLGEGQLSVARAVALSQQLLLMLSEAHAEGVVHGLLSPASIRVSSRGGSDYTMMDDFGLAAHWRTRSSHADARFEAVTRYVAPEACGGAALDPRQDLYSVGAILYAMLAGAPPFADAKGDTLVRAIVHDDVRKLRELRPDLRVSLTTLVSRAMRKDPDQRFGSAQEMLDALAPLLQESEKSSLPPPSQGSLPPMAVFADDVTTGSPATQTESSVADRVRTLAARRRLAWMAGAAAALVLVVGVTTRKPSSSGVPVEPKAAVTVEAAVVPVPAPSTPDVPTPAPIDTPKSVEAASSKASTRTPSAPARVVSAPPRAAPPKPRATSTATASSELPTVVVAPITPPPPPTTTGRKRTSADLDPYLSEQ